MFARFMAFLVVACELLGGCTYYPGFTNIENPELYYIRAGDVVGGIKCAMFSFLNEREYRQGGDVGAFDHKRFELDPSAQATLELQLINSTSGQILYSKIDAAALASTFGISAGASVVAIGNTTTGIPFPSANATAKGTNTVVLSMVVAQTLDDPSVPLIYGTKDRNGKPFSNRAADVPDGTNAKYVERCLAGPDRDIEIDYIGLKNWLVHALSDEEDAIWRGAPEVFLDTITLTTLFDIQADVSFGVSHILKLVPLVGVPSVDLKPDRSHQLKITLRGFKKAHTAKLSKGGPSPPTAADIQKLKNLCFQETGAECKSPTDLLLQRVLTAVSENKKP